MHEQMLYTEIDNIKQLWTLSIMDKRYLIVCIDVTVRHKLSIRVPLYFMSRFNWKKLQIAYLHFMVLPFCFWRIWNKILKCKTYFPNKASPIRTNQKKVFVQKYLNYILSHKVSFTDDWITWWLRTYWY